MLTVANLCKHVQTHSGRLEILNNVNFQVETGETVAFTGVSGSGKSTLLALLAGLDTPSSGEVQLDGQVLSALNEEQRAKLRQEKIGFIFQSFHLIPSLTTLDNVMLPLELRGEKKVKEIASELLGRVGLAQRSHHFPLQLSGGEQQRVAIARAFAGNPEILFADEPTGNLDQISGENIIQLLFEMNKEHNTTLILVTHDMPLAMRCKRHFKLNYGSMQEIES